MAISAWFSIFQSTPSTRRETRGQHHSDGNISFQSTPSTRRETPELLPALHIFPHFNPLPPHGGRHWAGGYIEDQNGISIHSLHTEGDLLCSWHCIDRTNISIHSLHTEGDVSGYSLAVVAYSFQSTPSTRRETPELLPALHIFPHFNPLPPHGGRHWAGGYIEDQNGISIHSLHTEGDC